MKSVAVLFRFAVSLVFVFASNSALALENGSAEEPSVTKTDVFIPGQDGIARYRIPGIVVTSSGTILAYSEARHHDSRDYGEIDIRLRRSVDGGRTWQPAQKIAHLGERIEGIPEGRTTGNAGQEQTVNNPVAIVDKQTGAIEFLYCVNYERCFSMRSTDDGKTFSNPVDITAVFEVFRSKYPWKVIATGPGHGIQLSSGRLVVPIWLAYGKRGAHNPSAAGTIYSDDHGKTWNAGEIAVPNTDQFQNPNETMIAELSNGKVLLVTRNVSAPNRKILTTSENGSDHWSDPFFHQQLWEPVCMASIVAHPVQPATLVYSNPHTVGQERDGSEKPKSRGPRRNLTLKLSRDDGQTWPIARTLEAGLSAYSDLAVENDGTILCLYEREQHITLARVPFSWLASHDSAEITGN